MLQQIRSSSSRKEFVLSGPSGTGKSVSLMTLFQHFLTDNSRNFLPLLMTDSDATKAIY